MKKITIALVLLITICINGNSQTIADLGTDWSGTAAVSPTSGTLIKDQTHNAAPLPFTVYSGTENELKITGTGPNVLYKFWSGDVYKVGETFGCIQLDQKYVTNYIEVSLTTTNSAGKKITAAKLNGTSLDATTGRTSNFIVLFSDKAPFDVNRIIGYNNSYIFPESRNGGVGVTLTVPDGCKSFRIMRKAFLNVVSENPNIYSFNETSGTISLTATGYGARFAYFSATVSPYTINADADISSSSVPENSDVSVTAGKLTINQNSALSRLSVAPGAKLTLDLNRTLSASSLTINSDATGTGTFVNKGTSTITSATVNQYLTTGRNWYVSSPVTAAPYTVLSSATSVQYWNEATGSWAMKTTGTLEPGKGYISVATNATGNVTFTGTLNDGDITVNLTRTKDAFKSGFNLVGNPYPSYLSWESVEKTNVETSIWYRTKNTAGVYKFGTYNTTGQIGTNVGANDTDLKDIVTGNIPPMQAFWVRVSPSGDGNSTTGSLTFRNTMRDHKGTQLQGDGQTRNDGLLRVKAANESKVLRLQISNELNTDETILLFNNNASNGLDAYDSYKMSNNAVDIPEIYTTANGELLVINGLNNFENDLEIPVGFTTLKAGTFSIKASQVSSFEPGTQLILKDYINGMPVASYLSEGESYSFTSSESVNNVSRFTITLKAPSTITDVPSLDNRILITTKSNNLIINGAGKVDVINILGQKILTQYAEGTTRISLGTGVYMVTVTHQGQNVTQKVIIH